MRRRNCRYSQLTQQVMYNANIFREFGEICRQRHILRGMIIGMPKSKFSEMLQDWPMKGRLGGNRAARLEELRKSRSITQAKVAEHLGTNQGGVSRIERRTDIYISTLAQYHPSVGRQPRDPRRFPRFRNPHHSIRGKVISFSTWWAPEEFRRDLQDNVDNPDC